MALQASVLLSLVAGTAAWAATEKRVTVLLDGVPQAVSTHARTVGGVLTSAGLSVGAHDLLAPDRGVSVQDGSYVVLRRGRPVTVTIDGHPRHLWVTARSVGELLDQVGLRDAGLWLSASRSRPIPLGGLTVQLRLAKQATVVADGRPAVLDTTVPTVRGLLEAAQVMLAATDRTSVPLDAPVTDGLIVTVTRIRGTVGVMNVAVRQPVVREPDPAMPVGQTKVLQPGAPGVTVQTWAYTLTDGKVTARRLVSSVLRAAPRPTVLAVGTAQPAPQNNPSPDGLNWAALAKCESGGNPKAYNPAGPYYGLYQFSAGTWHAVGGAGLPSDASSSEQTYRAQLLYKRSGAGQWPVCGHNLFT
ncbi:MAG: ubiquitin-like domain-containing protein [Actinomycetota bacterium]|nr:ubiquitin-like domain-containing protein [Actinomycetota bacterium]